MYRPIPALVLALSTGLFAAEPATESQDAGFSVHTWQVEEGLPQNSVNSIVQTRDGYLWVGTYDGLACFDGERFRIFVTDNTPDLQDNQITCLFEDPHGVLWIGHDSGAVTFFRSGRFQRLQTVQTGVGMSVAAINADQSGAVWLLHQNGLLQCAADGRGLPPPPGRNSPVNARLVRDTAGNLYVLTDGKVSHLVDGKLDSIDFGPAHRTGFVMGLAGAKDGGLWVIRDLHVEKWRDGRWIQDCGLCPWGDSSITGTIEMNDGCLAVSTLDRGCYLVSPSGRIRHFDRSDGLPQNWVRCLYQDHEDDLWLGIGTGGLVMVKSTPFAATSPPGGWNGHTVLSVAPGRNDSLWIGTEGAGVYKFQAGTWSHFGYEQGLGNSFVWSIAEDADGLVWIGTWGGGMYQLRGGRCVPAPGFDTGQAPIFALEFSPEDHGLWAGVGTGLLRWQNGICTWAFQSPRHDATNICTVERDPSGAIWFGISGGGLGRLAKGHITVFRKSDGLPSDRVNCLLATDADVLWIGTADGGLCRMKNGRFSTIGTKQGLASNVICSIADDGRGFLWLSTHHGILRFAKQELNRCADGLTPTVAGQMYDRDDGLPTLEFSGGLNAAGCQTKDGRLWFASSRGLVSVDPGSIHPNTSPPPVVFESLSVDGRPIEENGEPPANLRLAPAHHRLEFNYTALSLVAPNKVKFRYRLVGLDRNWVDAGGKRSAFYSQLSAGRYQFQVIACNNDGVWNTAGAGIAFTVLPVFWQTWWFRVLAGLAVSLSTAWGVRHETRRRLHRRMERLEQERAVEFERTRIAQDIHDDIGASLTRITLLSQSVTDGSNQCPGSPAVLAQISAAARDVTQALDEIVWAVDPRHDTLESMICYMAKFAQDFLAAAHVRCRLDLPSEVPAWSLSAEARHNLFLAFKESLNNAVKHAAASEVRISLSLQDDAFVLAVKDNGRGIDPSRTSVDSPSGNGLDNLRDRLSKIGGRYELQSQPGEGTTVFFIVSGSMSAALRKTEAHSSTPAA
jgi:signal transduction histidine kinase/ligand-binding sensor domain-containing protein